MRAVAIDLEAVLGDTRPLWDGWLEEAARRFASIAVLDPAALPRDRGSAAVELDRWAKQGIGDWRSALERYAEEHAPLHLRPDPDVGATLRQLKENDVTVGVFTDAPEQLAQVALAQLGATRRIDYLMAGNDALERLVAILGRDAIVVRKREQLAQLRSERSR